VGVLIPEELRERHAAATRRFIDEGTSNVIEAGSLVFPALRRDGSRFDLEFSLARMREGEELRLVAVLRDVSQRVQLERMKSEFIATVSHELRTPLTSIVGSLAMLREVAGELPPDSREFVEMASRNSARLAELVNDVIDAERIESGALQFDATRFPIGELLVEAVKLNQSYAGAHGVSFVLDEPIPDAWVQADRGRLMQVLANLLSNAAKFSPRGEQVRVRATRNGDRVRVEVIDRGRGIPDEFKPRAFTRFAQADASDHREKGGTGLGLAICKAIIDRSGGTIGVDSRLGHGSTFWFELEATKPQPRSPAFA
jgi:signal transduction histidine kinase